jgi:hypothetical protein
LEKVGTITPRLVGVVADTGTITAVSPLSGVKMTEIASVPWLKAVPVIVSESKGLAVVSLSAVIEGVPDATVIVRVDDPDLVVSAVLTAVMVTGFVLGTALGAV